MTFTPELEELIAQYFPPISDGSTRAQHVISAPVLREFLQVFSGKIGRDAYDAGYEVAKGVDHD